MNQRIEDIINKFNANLINGLSDRDVKKYSDLDGNNKNLNYKKKSIFFTFLLQFKDSNVYLLAFAVIILLCSGEHLDAIMLTGILLLNAVIGTIQEWKIEKILNKLHRIKDTSVISIRNGTEKIICENDIVVGDILILQEGHKICADAYILQSFSLSVDESIITGESQSVMKIEYEINSLHEPLDINKVFAGSFTITGTARVLVFAIKDDTFIGKEIHNCQSVSTEMPLQKDLQYLFKIIIYSVISSSILLFVVGYFQGLSFSLLISTLVALFVCVVPQGFFVVMRFLLASGAHELMKKNIFVKKMDAIESISRINLIIMDKTGTMTCNEMSVNKLYCNDQFYDVVGIGYGPGGSIFDNDESVKYLSSSESFKSIIKSSILLNQSKIIYDELKKKHVVQGNVTSACLFRFATKAEDINYDELDRYNKIYEFPLSLNNKIHGAIFENNGKFEVFFSGSLVHLFEISNNLKDSDKSQAEAVLASGLRVVGFCHKKISEFDKDNFDQNIIINNLTFLGFVSMQDPLRSDMKNTLISLKRAGIDVAMATGDNMQTALFISKQLNVFDESKFCSGQDFEKMSLNEKEALISDTRIFAQMMPSDKLELIKLFQNKGYNVAMIGDGSNDVPAIKAANISIAIGSMASPLAQDAASIILLTDNFSCIIDGIIQSRHIFSSFKRVVSYFLIANFSEMLVVLICILSGFQIPLLAAHILWLNFITDGFLSMILALEKEDSSLLSQDWFIISPKLITKNMLIQISVLSLLTAICVIAVFNFYKNDIVLARTMILGVLTSCHLLVAISHRFLKKIDFVLDIFSSKLMNLSFALIVLLFLLIIYVPFLQKIFSVCALSFVQMMIIFATGIALFILDEARKRFLFD